MNHPLQLELIRLAIWELQSPNLQSLSQVLMSCFLMASIAGVEASGGTQNTSQRYYKVGAKPLMFNGSNGIDSFAFTLVLL